LVGLLEGGQQTVQKGGSEGAALLYPILKQCAGMQIFDKVVKTTIDSATGISLKYNGNLVFENIKDRVGSRATQVQVEYTIFKTIGLI
jgi:hypothetical protein